MYNVKKPKPLSPHDLSTGHQVGVSFITSLNSNLCTTVTPQITMKVTVLSETHKRGLHFSSCIFNWNALFTGHTQKVGFPQRKPLPRSSKNPTVTICELLWCEVLPVQH